MSKKFISIGSKIKLYQNIVDSEDLIRRNWKLINLDTNNLSHYQIKKIENSIDTFAPVRNKMNILICGMPRSGSSLLWGLIYICLKLKFNKDDVIMDLVFK